MNLLTNIHNASISDSSFCERFIAYTTLNRLIILSCSKFEVLMEFDCLPKVEEIQWSRNSLHVFCASKLNGSVEVFSLRKPGWNCLIKCGVEGLESVAWAPDSCHLLTLSTFNLILRIWDLKGSIKASFDLASLSSAPIKFSGCHRFLAIMPFSHPEEQNSLQVLSTTTWTIERQISFDRNYKSTPLWSPTEDLFLLYTSNSSECSVSVFTAALGTKIGLFDRPKSERLIGIQAISWSKCGTVVAIACYDGCIFVVDKTLNHELGKFESGLELTDDSCSVYKLNRFRYELVDKRPISFSTLDKKTVFAYKKENLLIFGSKHLARVDPLMPAIVWIWQVEKLQIETVLVLNDSVASMAWSKDDKLCIIDDSKNITLWNGENPVLVKIPELSEIDIIEKARILWIEAKNKLLVIELNSTVFIFRDV